MKIQVRVKPNSKMEEVRQLAENQFEVRVKEPPVDGRANEAVIAALAGHFGIPKSRVLLLRGASGKNKIFELLQ